MSVFIAGAASVDRSRAAEPTAASLAWTSSDPVVVEARQLVKDGKFSDAEKLLKKEDSSADAAAKTAREQMLDMIGRIRWDYGLNADQLIQQLHNRLPGVSTSQLEEWRKDGGVQSRMIDGKIAYFRREPANMNRFCGPYKEQVTHHRGSASSEPDRGGWSLVDHLKAVADEAEKTGQPYVLPLTMKVKFGITVPADASGMKPGALVRVWLPFPQEYGKRQFNVKMISSTPSNPQIAPPGLGDHPITGAAQRTVYFEQRVADPVKPLTFEENFEFTSQAYYPILSESKALPLPKDYADGNLGERLPHIAFTPELKATVAQILEGETNPLAQARRIFHWISANISYHAEQEYGTIPSFSEACLTRRRGDCGVESTLFITMCRCAGIPARWQSGFETRPPNGDMHDWSEIYIAPWGWLPCDASYGVQKSDDPRIRDFYCGHFDSYRMIVNRDWGAELMPPKPSLRSDPSDFQRGEVEIDGKNLYVNQWDYNLDWTWGSKP